MIVGDSKYCACFAGFAFSVVLGLNKFADCVTKVAERKGKLGTKEIDSDSELFTGGVEHLQTA